MIYCNKESGAMRCLYCKKTLKLFDQYCLSCGKKVFDDDPAPKPVVYANNNVPKRKRDIQPMFSDVECLMYGIYPDEEVKKILEYRVLTTDHSKQ